MSGQTDSGPQYHRDGGSSIIDYSLKESDQKLIRGRRKIAMLPDKTTNYSSATQDTIQFVISPGSDNEWLDGRSSFMTATLNVTGTTVGGGGANALNYLYLPNGPASCFSQVQIISASGQQLANIVDYSTIQQMFVDWTTCPTWRAGIGQMFGIGNSDVGDWNPAQFLPGTNGAPATYDPHAVVNPTAYSATATEAVGAAVAEQRSAGKALQNQSLVSGVTYAFRLDLAWIFGCPTLIPSQFFPLTIRCTLADPNRSLSWIGSSVPCGINGGNGAAGFNSLAPGNTVVATGVSALPAGTSISGLDLQFSKVRFMASLCEISAAFKAKVEEMMTQDKLQLTVTNYFTNTSNLYQGTNQANINASFACHDCQAHIVSMIPQANQRTLNADFAQKWGGGFQLINGQNVAVTTSSQLLVNGTYFPPQPNTNYIDMFHDTLAAFNTTSENVDFSPVSYYNYLNKNFVLGTLFDRDVHSSLTGINTIGSPTFSFQANFAAGTPVPIDIQTCVVYTQILTVKKNKDIIVWT